MILSHSLLQPRSIRHQIILAGLRRPWRRSSRSITMHLMTKKWRWLLMLFSKTPLPLPSKEERGSISGCD
ncbi:hypothetical protein EV363DRAFT_1234811 [Boletus edulis]|nr:hypothetical protein EV363DRAFT_1234811 [Boletus edulis]